MGQVTLIGDQRIRWGRWQDSDYYIGDRRSENLMGEVTLTGGQRIRWWWWQDSAGYSVIYYILIHSPDNPQVAPSDWVPWFSDTLTV